MLNIKILSLNINPTIAIIENNAITIATDLASLIKKDINDISSSIEMIGYLDGIEICAIIFCKKN